MKILRRTESKNVGAIDHFIRERLRGLVFVHGSYEEDVEIRENEPRFLSGGESADINRQRHVVATLHIVKVTSATLLEAAEKIGEIIFDAREIHFIEEKQKHLLLA